MGSSGFFVIILHSVLALTCGALLMFYTSEVFVISHGSENASKLLGSTPHDQLLIRTSDSFSGLLLFAIGFLLFMVAFVMTGSFTASLVKGVCCFTLPWPVGESTLRGSWKVLAVIG